MLSKLLLNDQNKLFEEFPIFSQNNDYQSHFETLSKIFSDYGRVLFSKFAEIAFYVSIGTLRLVKISPKKSKKMDVDLKFSD